MKRAFVTGGSRGIGSAVVKQMATAGWNVVFTYRDRADEAQALADSLGVHVQAVRMDLLCPESIRIALAESSVVEPGFDAVVHNAAICKDGPFYFMEERDWDDVIRVSLNSFFHINKAAIPAMVSRRGGSIVSVVSISGEAGNRGQSNYAAAKGALIAASKSLARELGPKGVRVNCVSPGIIETDMTAALPVQEMRKLIPLGRLGRPDEVASVIRFLASDDSSYMTGAVLRVNGGFYT